MPQSSELLLHQSTIDYSDSTADLYHGVSLPQPAEMSPSTDEEIRSHQAMLRVVGLKAAAGTLGDRVYDVASSVPELADLAPKRRGAFGLAAKLAAELALTDVQTSWYGLADVTNFTAHSASLDSMHVFKNGDGTHLYVRLEEALAVSAARIAGTITGSSVSTSSESDGLTSVALANGKTKTFKLQGYEFNRNSTHEGQREYISDSPSCDLYIAATVLDQVSLLPAVVRVIPYWMKNREYTARDMLRLAGHSNLPVLSVVAGEHGDITMLLPWGELPASIETLKPILNHHMAHRSSRQVTETVHDRVKADHLELYRRFCKTDLDSNIKPSRILDYDFLSRRVHEFLARTLPAAPLYEERKVTSENIEQVLQNINSLRDIMSVNFQEKTLRRSAHDFKLEHYKGDNTNDVTYVRMVLTCRPETDPTTLRYSQQVDLIGHFVFEKLPETLAAELRLANDGRFDIAKTLHQHPPRSVLLEARRRGADLAAI